MKQLLQHIKNGKTIIEDVPIPTLREGQALVKVVASTPGKILDIIGN